VLDADVSTLPTDWGGRRLILCIARDITARKQAETALAEESARTQLLFEKAFDSMFLLDEEFKVVEANARFATLLGRPLKEVYGLHPWDWDADRPSLQSAMDIGAHVPTEPMSFEARVRSLDGSVREVEVSTTPTEWSGRKLIFNVLRDITARKQAEAARREAEQQLRRVIDSLDEGLFIIDMEGKLLSWNPAARRIVGIPDEGFERVKLAQYPEFITVFAQDGSTLPSDQWPIVRALRGERIQNQEFLTRSKYLKGDRMISYSSSIVETGDGKKLAFLRCQDVTVRWRAENALSGSNI
jgi:PAS domain S-box-containing protein